MKCEEVQDLLWPYLAKELKEEEAAAISAHLQNCNACAQAAEEIKEAIDALGSLPEKELPQGFHEALMARLAQEQRVIPFAAKKKPQNKWKQYSLVAAAALLVVAVGGSQGILDMRKAQNEAAIEMKNPQAVSEPQTDILADGDGEKVTAIVAEEGGGYGASNLPAQEEDVTETPIVISDKKTTQNVTEKPRANKTTAPEENESSSPVVQNTGEGIPAADMPVVAAEGGRGLRSIVPEEVSSGDVANNAVVTYERVALEVKSKEGLRDELVGRATALGGYETATPEENLVFLAVPGEQAQTFYEGLKELGTPGEWTKPETAKTMLFFEITVEENGAL